MQVITRRRWPWIPTSEIMVVNYFWCNGFGRNHHDNVQDWIHLQRKECMKEAIIISAKCFVFTSQNSPRTYGLPMSVIYFFTGTGSAQVMIVKLTPFLTPPLPPNWPHQLQTPSCGPDYKELARLSSKHY